MKKAIPWVVGIILILIGVLIFANSIIAGLLFLPPVVKFLASKQQLSLPGPSMPNPAWLELHLHNFPSTI